MLAVVAIGWLFAATADAAESSDEIVWHASSIPAGDQPFDIVAVDLDNDGDIDLAATDSKDSTFSVYLGNGDGSFAPRIVVPTGPFPRAMLAGDFNQDGLVDLAAGATNGRGVYVHDNRGGGRFTEGRFVVSGGRPFLGAVADWNADGHLDIGIANERKDVSILTGDGKGGFASRRFEAGKWPSAVGVADWNGDGHLDWAVTNWGDNDVTVRFGDGRGEFPERRDVTYDGHALFSVVGADIDRDGKADMVWNDMLRYGFWILYGDGAGNFPRTAAVPAGQGIRSVKVADLDADGWLDLVATDTASGDVSIARADGHGGFHPTQFVPVGVKPRVVTVADLNGDKAPDLVVTNMDSDSLTLLTQQGRAPRSTAAFDPGPEQTRRILDLPGLKAPSGLAVAPNGDVIIADQQHNRVVRAAAGGGTLTTIAGTGQADFQGDHGAAIDASLHLPSSVACAADGTLFIADFDNNRIRKVDPAGVITTVAGTGESAFSGDGGPATAAALSRPFSLALAPDGSLYIVDLQNNRIRRIDPNGVITTVAGTGSYGLSGDGGPATQAQIGPVTTIAVDASGNLFIADQLNRRIRKLDRTGTITTVASEIGLPTAIAPGPDGQMYFATADKVGALAADGTVRPVADLATARSQHTFTGPATALAVAADGSVLLTDPPGNAVRRIAPDGTVSNLAGGA